MVRVIKKDHTREAFNIQKVVTAVNKSANRVLYTFTDDELKSICDHVEGYIRDHAMTDVQIWQMHNIVESALEAVRPEVAKSYRDYRNYKQDFVGMLDSVYKKSQSIMYIGDRENSNTDSALVSTKRSLIFNQLNKELYQKFFMNSGGGPLSDALCRKDRRSVRDGRHRGVQGRRPHEQAASERRGGARAHDRVRRTVHFAHDVRDALGQPREIFLFSLSRPITNTLTLSPTETTSDGCLMRPQDSSEMCTMPSTPPMSTNAP